MAAVVDVENLSKSWAGKPVLRIARLRLHSGESYVLSGDNGAGKSTLLRVLAGLEPAQVGRFVFDGQEMPLHRLPRPARLRIGFVHQHPYMFSGTVRANVEYGLRARGIARHLRGQLTTQALAWAAVEPLAEAQAQQLSGGEKQRVAIARVKVLSPHVYLLDEPTANLDADGRRRVIDLISQLAEQDKVVVVACHDQEMISLPGVVRLHLENGRLRD
jgi:tungstate transport system ATP-binding protein